MFAREKQEISVYNRLRQELEHASVRTKGLICVFYFGQNVIVSLSVLIGMIITTYDGSYRPHAALSRQTREEDVRSTNILHSIDGFVP